MKTRHTEVLVIRSRTAPTVEIDTEASAAYVRFRRGKVVQTRRHVSTWPIVTIDLDARGEVVGVEFIGVKKFNLGYLLAQIPLKASRHTLTQANYVSAETEFAAA